ncbi:ABC transporter permease subunit [Clostridium amazonitimonense]|uniref:ABC transporter permease subunit n=1 Tax=Clostridium amazonitimonense TaxID=1499689 RepID=UPI000509E31F|nr:ABC transporter permease subunit [Clostridium amazonitimonense]
MLERYEAKRILKKKSLPILIIAFILIGMSVISNLISEDFNNGNSTDLDFSTVAAQSDRFVSEGLIRITEGEEKIGFSQMLDNSDEAIKNRNQGNLLKAYKHEMIVRIIHMNLFSTLEHRRIFEDFTKEVWNDIAPDITYPDNNGNIYNTSTSLPSDAELGRRILDLKCLYKCYKNNIPYVGRDDANEAVFLYELMDKIIPVFILLTILLLSIDSISEEHRLRITRNVLSQPISRFSYFLKVLFSNIITVLPVIIISISIVTLFSGVLSRFHSFKMPILTTTNQWTALRINGMDLVKAASEPNGIGYLGPVPVVWYTLGRYMYSSIKFISFTKATIIFTLEMVLFALFVNIVTVFASSLTNKKSIALVIAAGIFGGLYGLLRFIPELPNPLLALKVRDIISGASSFTLLSLTLIQVSSILIMLGISAWVFNKKEIVY